MDKIFVIGDIHGCFYTLQKMIEHWNPRTEQLIFVGDLIDRGNFSPETVDYVKRLCKKDDAVCIMGNHEYAAVKEISLNKKDTWFKEMGKFTISQYENSKFKLDKDLKWFADLPLVWQNEKFIISHAGISKFSKNPFDKNDTESVLWTRSELKVFPNKIQIHGHTPNYDNPIYYDKTNSWNIDSACVYDYYLTGIKFNIDGTFIEKIKILTEKKDIPRKYKLSE